MRVQAQKTRTGKAVKRGNSGAVPRGPRYTRSDRQAGKRVTDWDA